MAVDGDSVLLLTSFNLSKPRVAGMDALPGEAGLTAQPAVWHSNVNGSYHVTPGRIKTNAGFHPKELAGSLLGHAASGS